jgi:hypothetical protein
MNKKHIYVLLLYINLFLIKLVQCNNNNNIIRNTITTNNKFEPLTKNCTTNNKSIDDIDHCCRCNYNNNNNIKKTPKLNITPKIGINLPKITENIGTSLCVTKSIIKNRIIIDNHPDFNDNQNLEDNTLVHILEYDKDLKEWIHIPIEDTPKGMGHTIDCSDNYILIGNPGSDTANVALIVKAGNTWSLSITYKEINKMSEFGYSVGLDESNKNLIISDPSYNNNVGRVYIYFTYLDIIIDTLDHPNGLEGSRFGHEIVIKDDLIIIGSPYDSINGNINVGSVHLFKREVGGSKWFHFKSIYPPIFDSKISESINEINQIDRRFGWKIAMYDNYFIIGSYNSHYVEVYRKINNDWKYMQTLSAPDMTIISKFGTSLDIFKSSNGNNRIVIGDHNFLSSPSALGKVFSYEYSLKYDEWLYCQTFIDDVNSFQTHFGQSVQLTNLMNEDLLIIAAPDTDSNENSNGNIWLYNLDRKDQCSGCDNIINSDKILDICGICDGNNSTCSGCDGIPFSNIKLDYCNICNGDNTTCLHTNNIIELNVYENTCNKLVEHILLHEPSLNKVDWNIINHPSHGRVNIINNNKITYKSNNNNNVKPDSFRLELSDNYGHYHQVTVNINILDCIGCDGIKNSGKVIDICGICDGNNSTCVGCDGIINSNKIIDYCEKCTTISNSNKTCIKLITPIKFYKLSCGNTLFINDQNWEPKSNDKIVIWNLVSKIESGIIIIDKNYGNITYTHKSNKNINEEIWYKVIDNYDNFAIGKISIVIDDCKINRGIDSLMLGCDKVIGSGLSIDKCGVCGGNNECIDCNGIINGGNKFDYCGVCGGDNSTCPEKMLLLEYDEKIVKKQKFYIDEQNLITTNNKIPLAVILTVGVSIILGVLFIIIKYLYFKKTSKKLNNQYKRTYTGYYYNDPRNNNNKKNSKTTLNLVYN